MTSPASCTDYEDVVAECFRYIGYRCGEVIAGKMRAVVAEAKRVRTRGAAPQARELLG